MCIRDSSQTVEDYLTEKSLVTWSTDVVADDWRHIGAKEIVKRAMRRLDEKGRGILLLHDIHPATVMALPSLLNELKDKGCLLYTSDAADDLTRVDLGGRRIIKKKKK